MRLELIIDGMLAVHARHAVFTALAAVAGLRGAEVELGRAVVEFEEAVGSVSRAEAQQARHRALGAALEAAGFTLRGVRELPRQLPTLD